MDTPPPKHQYPDYRKLMNNCEQIRQAFNTISLLSHELKQTAHEMDQIQMFEYSHTLKALYERWERERRQIYLPTWADRSAPFISTVQSFIDGKQEFIPPPNPFFKEPAPRPSLNTPEGDAEGQALLKRLGDKCMYFLSSGKLVANPNCPAIQERMAAQKPKRSYDVVGPINFC